VVTVGEILNEEIARKLSCAKQKTKTPNTIMMAMMVGLIPDYQEFLNHWIVEIVSALLSAGILVGLYYLLWIFGKHTLLSEQKRKHFFLGGFVILFFLIALVLRVVHPMPSNTKVGFHGSILYAGRAGGAKLLAATTNAMATISGISTGPEGSGSGFDMIFILHVSNDGESSTAWNWKAQAKLDSGHSLNAIIPSVAGIEGILPTVIGPFTPSVTNNLLQMLSSTPLPKGGAVNGWALIHVAGMAEPPVGAQFIVSFDDAFGHHTEVIDHWVPPFQN